MRAEVDRVLREEFFLRGETVERFETEFTEYVDTDHAIAVDSGTQALHISLRSIGVSEGDTVITTPATFISTANAILRTGADVKFADVDLETYTIDLEHLEHIVDTTPDVAAIVPVHLYGYPVPMDELQEIAGDIPIVSDACQAHGASYKGKKVGARSTLSCFSFYPSKNMTVAGDGGMIVTNHDEFATAARSLRDVGRSSDGYEHESIGYTARMGTMNAAVGREQLARLDDWNEHRRAVAQEYTDGLSGIKDLVLPPLGGADRELAWYLYVVRTPHRENLQEYLEERGIETGIHYPTPVHLFPPYRERGFDDGMFPAAERWADEVLSLPMHPELQQEEIDYVINHVREFFHTV